MNKNCKIESLTVIFIIIFMNQSYPVCTSASLAQICYNLSGKHCFIYKKLSLISFFSARQCGRYISVKQVFFVLQFPKLLLVSNKLVNCQLNEGLFEFLIYSFLFFNVCFPVSRLRSQPQYVVSGAFRCQKRTVSKVITLWLAVTSFLSVASETEANY